MRNYIGLIHKDADSHFGVSFPDFPGVITAGTTLDDARAMAEEALALHIEGLVEDGEAIPEPSALEDALAETLAWYRVAHPSHPGYANRAQELLVAR